MWYNDILLYHMGSVGGPPLDVLRDELFQRAGGYQPTHWQCHIPQNLRDIWGMMDDNCRMVAFIMAEEEVNDSVGR